MYMRQVAAALLAAAIATPAVAADPYQVAPAAPQQSGWQQFNGSLDNWFGFNADEAPVNLPACSDQKVVSAALKFTNAAQPAYRVVRVAAIDNVFEQALEADNPSPLARRYCRGQAHMADGRITTAHIRIEEADGFVGAGWAVNVCLDGYDKWRVYDGTCRTARPAPDS
ncbi:hypothetical protein [Amorphus sp. 3PC139-8]|uniref:hypothetical protein n=1 Tax=Amorphus sp. 3PC139-8 TaxID=2735676 RepID=UPI00345D7E16